LARRVEFGASAKPQRERQAATAELLKLYGAEVYGYVCTLLKDEYAADEARSEAAQEPNANRQQQPPEV